MIMEIKITTDEVEVIGGVLALLKGSQAPIEVSTDAPTTPAPTTTYVAEPAAAPAPAPEPTPEAPKRRGRPAKVETEPTPPAPEPRNAVNPPPPEAPAAPAGQLGLPGGPCTAEQLRQSLTAHREKWGLAATKGVVLEVGGTDDPRKLTPDQFAAVRDALDHYQGSAALDLSEFE